MCRSVSVSVTRVSAIFNQTGNEALDIAKVTVTTPGNAAVSYGLYFS